MARFTPLPILLALLLSSCTLTRPPVPVATAQPAVQDTEALFKALPPLNASEETGDLGMAGNFTVYNRDPLPSEAKIFLIAGKASDAAYLQEIVDQRKHWMSHGYSSSEIACYYVAPTPSEYAADKTQFEKLIPEVANFYLAAPHRVFQHLRSLKGHPLPFVYVYFTSEGRQPMTTANNPVDQFLLTHYADVAKNPAQECLGGPSGRMNERMRLEAMRIGFKPAQMYFTPQSLASALSEIAPEVPKAIIIQGSYSGGFAAPPAAPGGLLTLSSLPNAVIFTSTSASRASIPHKVESERTPYGNVFLTALREQGRPIGDVNWKLLSLSIEQRIDDEEVLGGVAASNSSNPQYLTTLSKPTQVATQ